MGDDHRHAASGAREGPQRARSSFRQLESHGLFAQAPPAELYHYTSIAGAYGIIESQKLLLTRIQYLNDITELRYAIDLFAAAVRGWAEPLGAREREYLAGLVDRLGRIGGANVCVASFCEDGDLLSQWRAYASDARGVALGFSGAFLTAAAQTGAVRTWKCAYDPESQTRIVEDLVRLALRGAAGGAGQGAPAGEDDAHRSADDAGWFDGLFLQVAPVLKHHSFHEEKEWRIVSAPDDGADAGRYDVVLRGPRLLPVFALDLATGNGDGDPALASITIGPTADPDLMSGAFRALLDRNGHTGCRIEISKIPYRAPQ